jgi:hypothetical protein
MLGWKYMAVIPGYNSLYKFSTEMLIVFSVHNVYSLNKTAVVQFNTTYDFCN